MSVALFPPFSIEIGDFVTWVKARNAFLTRGFLPSDAAKLVILFLIQYKYVINLQNNANALRYSFLGSKETTFTTIDAMNEYQLPSFATIPKVFKE